MRLFIFSLLFFACLQGFAAKEYLIDLHGDSYYFKNLGFEIEYVQDNRDNRENIGYTSKGLFEVKTPINFNNGFEASLTTYMSNLISNDSLSTLFKVVVKKLLITEKEYSLEQIGSCQLILEFYDTNGKLIYMTDYSGSFSSFDASNKYEGLIKYLIKKSILSFSLYDVQSNIYYDLLNQYVSYDTVIVTKKLKKGFYANFKEFQVNNPSLQFDFSIEEIDRNGKKFTKVSLADPLIDKDRLFDLIYGFSDGKNVYIKKYVTGGYYTFIPVQSIGRYCYVGKKMDNQGVPIILPFVIGAVSIPYEKDFIMNISSGKEYPLTEDNLRLILKSDKELSAKYESQPYDRRIQMGLYWIKEYNRRYLERLKK